MKFHKTAIILVLFAGLLFSISSCVVLTPKDNGHHKGWFKNSNNPHHPHSAKPGKSNGHHKK